MDQAEPLCTLKNNYDSKVDGNTDTMIIITAEATFVFKINSWLACVACVACVAGACPVLSCAITSKNLPRRLTVGNRGQLKYFIEVLHRTEDRNYVLYLRL